MTDQEIISLIKKRKHSKALANLYKNYPSVQKYVINYGGTITDAEDIFQDGLIILLDKTNKNNFILHSSLATFLFGICKNLCREKFRNSKRTLNEDHLPEDSELEINAAEFYEEERKYNALDRILIETGNKCMDLLKMFYIDNLSMKTIAVKLGFSSETSAKTQKYKCIEKARNLTTSILMEQKETIS
ncbi:MAG: sigma-70 family RNA polymerase sigma factor [Bacteroidales bacterium]